MTRISKVENIQSRESLVILTGSTRNIPTSLLSEDELKYIKSRSRKGAQDTFAFNRFNRWIFLHIQRPESKRYMTLEKHRKAGNELAKMANKQEVSELTIIDNENKPKETLAFAEGLALGNYQFNKYKKETEVKTNRLESIKIYSAKVKLDEIKELNILIESVFHCRNLVNEPVINLNAIQLSEAFIEMGRSCGAEVKVFDKRKITELGMTGLLAVNLGSVDLPTFTVMEWKPARPKNDKPIILVGKGVVYDTGGLSLKPSQFMENMKSDMAGAATVASAVFAISKANLPYHVIALIPATDNRPNERAYAPGDVIKMRNGLFVEVLNTDAEGRMILADALDYAKEMDPELVIDMATLTGAAHRAIGPQGIVVMGTADQKVFDSMEKSGKNVYERIVRFPFWDEYKEQLKSKIADIKNIGGATAGAITAGKFLEHFTDYPWVHMDIAGPAFLDKEDHYHPYGGSGIGVRLIFDFIKNME